MERRVQGLIGAALIVVLAVALAVALSGEERVVLGLATEDPGVTQLETVPTRGTGVSSTAPDQAEMSFGVETQGADARETLAQASSVAAAIVDAVKDAGVDGDDIQTTDVSIWPDMDYRDNAPAVIVGYRASVRVRVTVREIEDLGDVIEAATDAGANSINGPSFSISDDNPQAHDALQAAVEDARNRAEAMAQAAGKDVGEVLSMSETGVSAPPVMYGYAAESMEFDMVGAIEPGQLDVSASVSVVFELK